MRIRGAWTAVLIGLIFLLAGSVLLNGDVQAEPPSLRLTVPSAPHLVRSPDRQHVAYDASAAKGNVTPERISIRES